ncbi:hypothetical protein CZ771_08570 [Actinomycetales bacterium JB111]|nr:hypothetical protein CZ771_08570 [Actinomycetales bacterium JB111]
MTSSPTSRRLPTGLALLLVGLLVAVATIATVAFLRPGLVGLVPGLSGAGGTTSDGQPFAVSADDLTEADGLIPGGTTLDDTNLPGIARLDASLADALREASSDYGMEFVITTGWRSERYQAWLLQDAIDTYGSAEEASRWVATPSGSAHVSGDAVDLQFDAADWLSRHGAAYGLCRTYANESWHYELRDGAAQNGCPEPLADASSDPRQ